MPLRLEARPQYSRPMLYATPVLAVVLTIITGAILFSAIGYNGPGAMYEIFFKPILDSYRWQDLGVKAAPLIIIAIGLAAGFRANVWNIGAEGQYVFGALAGTGVALATYEMTGWWILPLMCIVGAIGGAAYAVIPAFLRTRLGVNEILTSLMLTYAAIQLLFYLMNGPWKDPEGFGFPQSRTFTDYQILPTVIDGTVVHLGVPLAFLIAIAAWIVLSRTLFGYQISVVGLAPAAARHGGFDANRTVWHCFLISGALAGLAGIFEASGAFNQMVPQFPTNYGFTAIIVAFLGRLHPIGIILAGLILAVSYVGGEGAQTSMGLPAAGAWIVQAMMLFYLLAVDILVRYRIKFKSQIAGGAA